VKAVEYAALDLMLGSFAARHDAYVQNSRAHVNAPLTPEVAALAFKQGHSLSGYMAVPRVYDKWHPLEPAVMMTHVGAIDFDLDGDKEARDVRAFLAEQDIPSLLVGSRRGAHLWVITNGDVTGMVPAHVMRRALHAAVHLCVKTTSLPHDMDESEMDEHIEVFPKNSDKDWGVGALRMPLFKHPKTGVRYPAYDPFDDREVTSIVSLVNLMADLQMETSYNALRRLAGADPVPAPYPTRTGLEKPVYAATGDVPRVSDLLIGYGGRAKPGHSVRCPFHDDRKASLSISADDERVWCKSPTCDMHNNGIGMGSIDLQRYLDDRKESPHAARGT